MPGGRDGEETRARRHSGPFSASIWSRLLKLKMLPCSSLPNSLPSLSLHALGPVLLTPCQLLLPS